MKQKKKRTKKYDPTLKFQELARLQGHRYKIVSITGIDTWVYKDNQNSKLSVSEAHALNEVRHKWSIVAGVICRDHFGKEYIKTEYFVTQDHYFSTEINDYLADIQRDLWNTANQNHKLTIFWIASPCKCEYDEKTIFKILNNHNAFKAFITLYEENKQKEKNNV